MHNLKVLCTAHPASQANHLPRHLCGKQLWSTHTHTHMHAHTHAHTHTRTRTHAHMRVRAHARTPAGMQIPGARPCCGRAHVGCMQSPQRHCRCSAAAAAPQARSGMPAESERAVQEFVNIIDTTTRMHQKVLPCSCHISKCQNSTASAHQGHDTL